ncbi:MAG: hypothetical protein ACLQLH_07910 [Terracidiphilus sp.]
MADHSKMRLGRRAIRTDSRTLAFGKYLKPKLPPPPHTVDWTKGITAWGTMLNDTLSDCTIAAAAHAVQVWTANTGGMVTVPDATVESYYEQWDGYVAGNPQTDTGGVPLDVLTDWRKQGFASNALMAFADPKFASLVEVRQSIALFGGVYIGLALPMTAQTQDVWDVVGTDGANAEPNSWGGHCVYVPKYDEKGFTCITWGQLKTMTLAFWKKYCDEAHTLLAKDWLSAKGAPNGFDHTQLEADLKVIV